MRTTAESVQWQPTELDFAAGAVHGEPLELPLRAQFAGPNGAVFEVPGFWDGGSTWRVRFTPTAPGRWEYATASPEPGLDGRRGAFDAAPAASANPLYTHGGFLRAGPDGRYLTYTDGTPFFWLGDTWWHCPGPLMPFDGSSREGIVSCVRHCADRRAAQGFTVLQMAFSGSADAVAGFTRHRDLALWREADRVFDYVNARGLLVVFGLTFHTGLDALPLSEWESLWRYVVARYGAHAVSWLICGEYNFHNEPARVEKALAIGRHIKRLDPYRRAMTVHPWAYQGDRRQVWGESWYDIVLLQGGHERKEPAPAQLYREACAARPRRPVVEGETRYEGLRAYSDAEVRQAAYRAYQCGAAGFTYGSQGLWYPTQDDGDTRFSEWGEPRVWWEALERPGGEQMGHLKRFYTSQPWTELEPAADLVTAVPALAGEGPLAQRAGDGRYVIYFPPGIDAAHRLALRLAGTGGPFAATWFDPRSGRWREHPGPVGCTEHELPLPARPDDRDWLLVLARN